MSTARTATETVANVVPLMKRVFENPSASRTGKYVRYEPLTSENIYKVGKYYLGRLQSLPPPSEISIEWDQYVSKRLADHLLAVTRALPKELRDEETFTEPVLCMAGKECKPQYMNPGGMVGNSTEQITVLQPTVWIFCGSRKCRRKVKGSLPRAIFLHNFLRNFDMEEALVTLEAPRPAADCQVTYNLPGVDDILFHLERIGHYGYYSGLKARYTVRTEKESKEYISTIEA
ncbi:uncharacterized protein BDV17DRAFT_289089 [Aspergillus undulatus]|uniref:uncharacterized protein n=1 Tax=Aspergillus undulatus TaxID=1810928 RepID=UPI003CCCBCC9